MSMLSQQSGNVPTSTAGTALASRDALPHAHFHFNLYEVSAVGESVGESHFGLKPCFYIARRQTNFAAVCLYWQSILDVKCTGVNATEHSPGVSLNTNFQLTGQSLLDESESSSADEQEVIRAYLILISCTSIFLSNILVL